METASCHNYKTTRREEVAVAREGASGKAGRERHLLGSPEDVWPGCVQVQAAQEVFSAGGQERRQLGNVWKLQLGHVSLDGEKEEVVK